MGTGKSIDSVIPQKVVDEIKAGNVGTDPLASIPEIDLITQINDAKMRGAYPCITSQEENDNS